MMGKRLEPVVGHWYSHLDKGDLFQVVALDEMSGSIEIQEFDGALDEVDLDEWRQMPIEAAEQPEDWSGPVDDVEPDELGYTDMQGEDLAGDGEEASVMTWQDILEEAEDEDVEDLSPSPARAVTRGERRRDH